MSHEVYLRQAIDLALDNTKSRGAEPFGALIVKDGEVLATGVNEITACNDPTAHAEIQVVRKACEILNTPDLTGYTLYASSRPCPLCVEAMGWANLAEVYYAATFEESREVGFTPSANWDAPFERIDMKGEQLEPFKQWKNISANN